MMKKRGSINWRVVFGFILLLAFVLVSVFLMALAAGQETAYESGANKYHIPDARKKVVTHIVEDDKKVKAPPVVNLVGECPPSSDSYQCPIDPQITEREMFILPVDDSESVRIFHFEK